jgi:hypothetical protein
MNFTDLTDFNISDAVTFHDKLNPKLWQGQHLRPEVKDQLEIIAQDFLQELGVKDLDVKDITVSGSNAAYSYTPHSDLDLHILVDMSGMSDDAIYKELFNAKKTIYNDTHDIKIHGVPVELYVQDAKQPVISLGEYSLKKDKWLRIPTKRRANFDQNSTKAKYEKLLSLIDIALKSKKYSKVKHIIDTIKRYRQAGLDKGGEFGPENIAYKALRSQGYITQLYSLRDKLHSEKLTIETMYDESKLLDKPTPTVEELMAKHRVTKEYVLKQLDKGIKVEKEHTGDRLLAREIALDHLSEDPNYYTKLDNANLEEDDEFISEIAKKPIVLPPLTADRDHLIYVIINDITNQRYVGITAMRYGGDVYLTLRRRMQKHLQRARCETKDWGLCKSLREYGPEAFSFGLLEVIPGKKPAHGRETELINQHSPELNTFKAGRTIPLEKMLEQDTSTYTNLAEVDSDEDVAEGSSNNIPTIGINVRSDGNIDYASLIVDGGKKYESRKTDSLRPYVGKTVGIVRTGNGPAVAIGQVTIGEPIVVDVEKFNKLRNQHLVPQGSKFDIDSDSTKYLYPMINPVRWDNEKPIKHRGIVSRKIQEQGVTEGESNDTAISLSKLGKFHPGADTLAQFVPERATAQYALHPDKWESTFYSLTNKDSDKLKYYGPKKISIPSGTLVGDMAIANKFYRAKTSEEKQQYAEAYKASLQPYPVDVSKYRMPELLVPKQGLAEGLQNNGISFRVQKGKNKFATTMTVNNEQVGVYQYDANTGRSVAEVYPEFKGKGFGKLLVLHAIYTAAKLGLDFQEDESRTAEYDNVLDSLSSNSYIVDDDGYWYVTGEGEQYLQQSLKQGVAEGYSVSDFKMNCFESMGNFIKWIRSPKLDKRGVTRTLGDQYANLIHTHKGVLESTSKLESKAQDAKILSAKLKQLDQRDNVVIKVGKKISILSVSIIPADKFSKIEVSGFVKPKEIVKINVDNNNKIDTIEFSDGSIFPEAAEFTTVDGVNLTNTIFFPNETSVSKAYTSLWMWLNSLEGNGWTIEKYMSEDHQSIEEASGYIPSNAEKNDPRFKSALTVDVKPNAIKKNAKAFSWLTTRAGIPPTARPDGKV